MIGDLVWTIFCLAVVVGAGIAIFRYRASASFYAPWKPISPSGKSSVYRLYRMWRVQAIVTVAAFGGIGIALVVISATGRAGPGWGFTALWVAGVAVAAYLYLFRVAYELELSDDQLLWKAPVRSGRAPLQELTAVKTLALMPGAALIAFRTGTKVLVLVQPGFRDFARDVARAAPHSSVEVGVFGAIADRFGGRNSGYSSRDRQE